MVVPCGASMVLPGRQRPARRQQVRRVRADELGERATSPRTGMPPASLPASGTSWSLAALLDEARGRTPPRWTPARRRSRRGRCRCRSRGSPCGRWPPGAAGVGSGASSGRVVATLWAGSAPGWACRDLSSCCRVGRPRRGAPLRRTLVRNLTRCATANSRSSVAASGLRSSSGPTLALVPRNGSSIGHPLQGRLAGDVEDHRVPGGGGDLVGVLGQALAAEVGPGVAPGARAPPRGRLRRTPAPRTGPGRAACGRGPCPARTSDHWMSMARSRESAQSSPSRSM